MITSLLHRATKLKKFSFSFNFQFEIFSAFNFGVTFSFSSFSFSSSLNLNSNFAIANLKIFGFLFEEFVVSDYTSEGGREEGVVEKTIFMDYVRVITGPHNCYKGL